MADQRIVNFERQKLLCEQENCNLNRREQMIYIFKVGLGIRCWVPKDSELYYNKQSQILN